ncbi:MAG: site-specific DNA-methyltransferase [Planctomycetes bacterium]|jgi:site-specific DNA-methyltransferase (adenine-specific)|nr:site-specific DNA-methyltransferase [Planctomycetota bacterium]MCL4729828.1 site-specific DNA-methyltransferase [Planctomycetota bacterium]
MNPPGHARKQATNGRVIHGDNLAVLRALPDGLARLIYIDPPFNTGRRQQRRTVRATRDEAGTAGFQGARYRRQTTARRAYADDFDDYLGFLRPRIEQARRLLTPDGALYFHIDYREAHYARVNLLDPIFGREALINEIIWAYDFGGRPRDRWPAKHDTIFFYAKDPDNFVFNAAEITREPYMAPGLVGPEKAARGKLPTDVWWHTIVGTSSREKTGYPTQKPLGVLRRIVQASSLPGDTVLDFFAGSGTTGAACLELGRRFVLVDNNPQAIAVMRRRFKGSGVTFERAATTATATKQRRRG